MNISLLPCELRLSMKSDISVWKSNYYHNNLSGKIQNSFIWKDSSTQSSAVHQRKYDTVQSFNSHIFLSFDLIPMNLLVFYYCVAEFKPIRIWYVTNTAETTGESNNGVRLNFVQFWMWQVTKVITYSNWIKPNYVKCIAQQRCCLNDTLVGGKGHRAP